MAIVHRRVSVISVALGVVLVVQVFRPAGVVLVAQDLRPAVAIVAQVFRPAGVVRVAQVFRPAGVARVAQVSRSAGVVRVAQVFRPAVLLAQSPTYGVGHPPQPDALHAIDIEVTPDGKGLPPGSGTATAGKAVYARRCEICHGPTGTEGPQEILVGGRGSLTTRKPVKTVGSYWPYATTLWDYINRAMPFDHPSTMTADEVYATTAYVLFLNAIVGEQDVLNQTTLPEVKMPNRNGFVADPRPDVPVKKKQ